jgi:cytochrome P450
LLFLFFITGLDTVTSPITNCLHYIATPSGTQEKLIADPSVIPHFIEEILRRYGIAVTIRGARQRSCLSRVNGKRF